VDTYWLSQPLTTSLNQRYSLNFEGGDQYFRYGVDLRIQREFIVRRILRFHIIDRQVIPDKKAGTDIVIESGFTI